LIVRNGKVRGKQRYKCKDCGLNFVDGDQRVKGSVVIKKALAVILYSLGKASFRMLGKTFGHSHSLMYRWISKEADDLPEPAITTDIKEMEFDEMWHFIGSKKTKSATSKRLYHKVKHLKDCIFYTDNWKAFAKVLPKKRHVIGKAGTIAIEQDNSNTRHHLGRMTRRTKVVSKSEKMVHKSIKIWCALTTPKIFTEYQNSFLSIFK